MDHIWRNKYGAGYRRLPRPVVVRAYDYGDGYREIWHAHEQAQLLYATNGVLRVLTTEGSWLLPPTHAMWVAPGVDHELHAVGKVALRSGYFEPEVVPWVHSQCSLIEVSGLLHELLLGMLDEPLEYAPEGRSALIVPLLLRCLEQATQVRKSVLPLPQDRRLRQLCEQLMGAPHDDSSLDGWSDRIGVSARTLARLFRDETGMTFGQWRQHMRIAEAIYRLAQQEPVKQVAATLGYSSAAAFITMFRKVMGTTPQKYLRT
ncbi:AraC family transcriptional regulator [Herbaspirillum chlorophenolicum]|uniref:AraC family transcriptional regulator n=1 Tax=Herbaspirillum chlorophenolicum TaxID=211589 RepID=A0ABW8ESX8_9BURK